MKKCSVCKNDLPTNNFSNHQISKGPERKCRSCLEVDTCSNMHQQQNFTVPTTGQITVTQQVRLVPSQEYDSLVFENVELKKKIMILEGNARVLQVTLNSKELEIAILKKENAELKKKIEELESRIKKVESTNVLYEDRFNALESGKVVQKFVVAIQDLNAAEFLEKALPKFSRKLMKFRSIRVADCHFIIDDDTPNLKKHKYTRILHNLQKLDSKSKDALERKVGGGECLQAIENFLTVKIQSSVSLELSDEEQSEIDQWWE